MDFNLIRRAAAGSFGRTVVIRNITTRHLETAASLAAAVASGSVDGGENLNTPEGDHVYVFGYTPMISGYIVR